MSRYRQRAGERYGMPVGDGMVSVERAARAVASAFGYGISALAPSGDRTHVLLLPMADESGGSENVGMSDGLPMSALGRVAEPSRSYLPNAPARREQALGRFPPEQRAQVEAFDRQADMRKNKDPYRVRQFKAWNHIHAGRVIATARPSRTVLQALSLIERDGPLADWLMVYAAGLLNRWPNVERYMVACGHPDWAAAEAAARMLGTRRPWREIAREQMMREADCRRAVQAAERRLWGWLERASLALLNAMG